MKHKILMNGKSGRSALYCAAIGLMCWAGAGVASAQAPADITPALQRVVNFAKGGMSDDFILNYITNSGSTFALSDDDIIYLHKQGVSDAVIKSLMQSSGAATPSSPPPVANAGTAAPVSTPTPPPMDASPSPDSSTPPPASPAPTPAPAPAPLMAAPSAPALQDNFFADGGLNSSWWVTQGGPLMGLGSVYGQTVFPELAFSPAGMRMSGSRGPGEFTGIQSAGSFTPPFTFTATVTGLAQEAVPFEVFLVSADLQQWLSVAGHLGGRGGPRGAVDVGAGFGHHLFGGFAVPLGGGRSPEYGMWINHTGSGWPIQTLGYKLFEDPIAGVPYTIQVNAGPDGAASVALLNPGGVVMAAQNVPIGMGPFYVVLAERGGRSLASWQSVQLVPTAPPPPPAPVAVAPPADPPAAPPVPTLDYFQGQLAPYGNWLTLPGYGLCWQPAVGPGWRPYYDSGSWTYTDAGWYWQSDYPWGDIAFHYGRWAYSAAGWVWVPGYDYAPAWVVWRHADEDGYLGWAPLPPGAVFVDDGWRYNGVRVGLDFDFGMGPDFYTFVPCDHFWDHDYRRFVVPHDRVVFFYHRSVLEDHYRRDHGVFINVGIGRDHIAILTHRDVRDIRTVDFHEVRRHEEVHDFGARREDIHDFHAGVRPDAHGFHGPDHGGFDRGAYADRPGNHDLHDGRDGRDNHDDHGNQPGHEPVPGHGNEPGHGTAPGGGAQPGHGAPGAGVQPGHGAPSGSQNGHSSGGGGGGNNGNHKDGH